MVRKVVVVGAGIAGLSFAWLARRRRPDLYVTVLEATDRTSGNVRTLRRDGRVVELGPDAFLAMEKGAVGALCEAVGAAPLIAPSGGGRVLVARGNRLHPLPEGLAMGLPRSFSQMAGTALLSPWGKLRAGADLVLPAHGDEAVSVGELVGRRLGREVKERLVEPIVGGIYGGDVDELDASVVMPSLAKVRGSLIRALALSPRPSGAAMPLRAPPDGIDTLTDALARDLGPERIRLRTDVIALEKRGAGWAVRCAGGEVFEADEVALATPPPAVAALVEPLDAGAAEAVRAFRLRAALTVIAAFPRADFRTPDASGALIPRSVDEPLRSLTALSFVDRKWPARVREDLTVVRMAVRPDRALAWGEDLDGEIVARALAALRVLLPAPEPLWTAVERYGQGTPQPTPGHVARVAAARERVAALGGLSLVGAAWDGPGIAGCVAGAQRAAERVAAG
ncbi:MAG: protoporphyrinogen oxidase [Polyangiales bacterium]